ncbi:MAG: Linoleoyl-CoA desaturase [Bacteroidetes bacterium]|jgi:linoleoyl-CoA desaturase|nr:Linoleoyl-CoA desaturase [Bacteroidota bacterium]
MSNPSIRFIEKDKNRAQFFAILRQRVDNHFKENKISKHGNRKMVVKTIVMLGAYIIPFCILLIFQPGTFVGYGLWLLMGIALSGVGMSVMHDANHGAYSSNGKVNFWAGHTLNLTGGSVFNWKLQHNMLHHTYTNVVHVDDDIDDKLVMRFSPHTDVKWYHRFQFIYAFFFYGILTLYWAVLKDFIQFGNYTKEGVNKESKEKNRITLAKIIAIKIVYFSVFMFIPIFVLGIPAGPHILGYLLMQFVSGIILTVIFQLAHTVEETSHPIPDADGTIENNWAIHQLNTTVNFSRKNKWISWYVGGLNFQVEHHLFPTICHVHYPHIAPIVKATAEEFGVPYLENETFGLALRSHIRTLKRFGSLPSLNEAIA